MKMQKMILVIMLSSMDKCEVFCKTQVIHII